MIDVVVVGEGQSEARFVSTVLTEEMAGRGIVLGARLIRTSPHASGGALAWERVLRFLRNTLHQRADTYVTTLFDLYRLPPDFPGLSEARAIADPLQRAEAIENAFHTAVVREAQCRADRFIPHIQPHELESLLFTDVDALPTVEAAWRADLEILRQARRSAASPEHVNDGANTHPSARLAAALLRPRYDKVLHGAAVARRIGTARIREECSHFSVWLTRLENLAPL